MVTSLSVFSERCRQADRSNRNIFHHVCFPLKHLEMHREMKNIKWGLPEVLVPANWLQKKSKKFNNASEILSTHYTV